MATAVMDSADAVMLGETSVGEFPVRVVEVMHKIIGGVEAPIVAGMPTSQGGSASTRDRWYLPDRSSAC